MRFSPIFATTLKHLRFLSTVVLFCFFASSGELLRVNAQPTLHPLAQYTQARSVKIYGAGGLAGLEEYQSGILVSPDGHIATAWSYVLDVDPTVVLNDGRRFDAKIVGFEPSLELAVLKIEESDLLFFSIPSKLSVQWADPVLAASNLFKIATGNEPASVMQGSIATITRLDARRGTFKTPYKGQVYVLDLVANNPGAAGGALVDSSGNLIGMLGKELRDSSTGVWLNYAIPASALRATIGDIIAGRATKPVEEAQPMLDRNKAHSPETIGVVMVPDVLELTPAYVDDVVTQSPADRSDMRPDDLILFVDGRRVDSQRTLRSMLRRIDRRDKLQFTIQRGTEILPITISPE